MNLENYIKDLSPELQEKARKCGNIEELLALAKEEKVELSSDALAAIGGGEGEDPQNCGKKMKCPKCGSTNLVVLDIDYIRIEYHFGCKDCGYDWWF